MVRWYWIFARESHPPSARASEAIVDGQLRFALSSCAVYFLSCKSFRIRGPWRFWSGFEKPPPMRSARPAWWINDSLPLIDSELPLLNPPVVVKTHAYLSPQRSGHNSKSPETPRPVAFPPQ